MNKRLRFRLLLAMMLFTKLCFAAEALPEYSQVYDSKRDPGDDALMAIALAKKTNRLILIEVGGDWCSWCHVLDKFIKTHSNVNQRLHQQFVILKVNVSDENDNASFMSSMPPVNGYPHMYIANAEGNLLKSQDTAVFLVDGQYSEKAFMQFFDYWQYRNE